MYDKPDTWNDIINKIMYMEAECLDNYSFNRKEGSLPIDLRLRYIACETGISIFK